MLSPIAVVRLDDHRYGAGPGTVVEVSTDPMAIISARHKDRDGCLDPRIRFWAGYPGAKPGDRVEAKPY